MPPGCSPLFTTNYKSFRECPRPKTGPMMFNGKEREKEIEVFMKNIESGEQEKVVLDKNRKAK